jgi:hypothetical protein
MPSVKSFVGVALLTPLVVGPMVLSAIAQTDDAPPVQLTAPQDHQRTMDLLHITADQLRPGRDGTPGRTNSANYDEATSNPYPNLPDPLKMKDGRPVTSAEMWWNQRRPEIVADMDSEVYGKVPAVTPKVTWEVSSVTNRNITNGTGDSATVFPVVVKTLVGHVDNSSYPAITVNIGLSLTLPANAAGPSPVIMVLSGGFGGGPPRGGGRGRGGPGAPGAPGIPAGQIAPAGGGGGGQGPGGGPGAGAGAGGGARRGGFGGGFGGGRGGVQLWQAMCLSNGWGFAALNTGSIQADNGAGLTQGIIGLCNKGQPRKVDDWGVLRAWGWGASRAMDYFETDPAVNAKAIGLEGHSRWGKGTIVAMAYDPRFAIAYVSSSGEGGAHINRRNNGETIGNLAGSGEYHWMSGNWIKYSSILNGGDLPVDGHDLIAMCAPRPVFISGGANGDAWQDPRGMFMAADAAGPVYTLLGKKALPVHEMPGVGVALIDSDIGFREHEQGHTDMPNWPTFLEFAGHYIKGPGLKAN